MGWENTRWRSHVFPALSLPDPGWLAGFEVPPPLHLPSPSKAMVPMEKYDSGLGTIRAMSEHAGRVTRP